MCLLPFDPTLFNRFLILLNKRAFHDPLPLLLFLLLFNPLKQVDFVEVYSVILARILADHHRLTSQSQVEAFDITITVDLAGFCLTAPVIIT